MPFMCKGVTSGSYKELVDIDDLKIVLKYFYTNSSQIYMHFFK